MGRALGFERSLADATRQISDPLEVGHHLENRGHEAQIGTHGLAPREELDTGRVNLALQPVDLDVGGVDSLSQAQVQIDESSDTV